MRYVKEYLFMVLTMTGSALLCIGADTLINYFR